MNGEQENCEEQQQESVTQLVTVSNANSPICFSQHVPVTDRQQNYLDHMSTAARQQQRDRDRKQHAEAHARLTDQQRQQQRDRNRERHRQAWGQQDLHILACVPLLEFDEASVPMLDIGGRTAECQQCRAMIWLDEASRGHANLCCAKGRSWSCEALFPISPP